MMTTRERRWLVAAIAFSLAVRLVLAGVVLVVRGDVEAFHTSDTGHYLELGASLGAFEGFGIDGEPELFRLPGFPVLVALASAAGHPTYGTLVIHAILGGVTTWLCFLWSREMAGERAGVIAAWLYALEPGQWTWSTLILTETLFTALLAVSGFAATVYVKHARRSALLWAVLAAVACAYVRLVGYVLPFVIIGTCVVLAGGIANARPRERLWRDGIVAATLVVVLLGAWHVRNGLTSGYWGFSTQVERAAFVVGSGVRDARDRGSYTDAVTALRREVEAQGDRRPSDVTGEMRRTGLQRIAEAPVAFMATYAAGIGATLVHPGTGAFMRRFQAGTRDDQPSVTQMLTLGRLADARRLAAQKGATYWLVAALLFAASLLYLGLFVRGAWRCRRSPLVRPALAMALGILALSGGPDGDSRRRAPLVPILCVVAAAALTPRRSAATGYSSPGMPGGRLTSASGSGSHPPGRR